MYTTTKAELMSLFTHTQLPITSQTSPTEALAQEVATAFGKVETELLNPGAAINNYSKVIGNVLLANLRKHGVVARVHETITTLPGQSSISLKEIPNPNDCSLYYLDSNGSQVVMLKIPYNSDFTVSGSYKLLGKVVQLFIKSDSSLTLTIDYGTTVFELGGNKALSNVIKNTDNSYLVPGIKTPGTLELTYDNEIQQALENHLVSTLNPLYLFVTNNDRDYEVVEITSYVYQSNKIKFATAYTPTANSKFITFINNVTIGDMLEYLYTELESHSHSYDELSRTISHKDLLDKFINTSKIGYASDSVPGYEHPQYLNREGHNPNIDAVFENALLGDLFLSQITEDGTDFKGLSRSSNRIRFGDPASGHSLYYDKTLNSLLLNSTTGVNGLTIYGDGSKQLLNLNGATFKMDGTTLALAGIAQLSIDSGAFKGDVITDSMTLGTVEFKKDLLDCNISSVGQGILTLSVETLASDLRILKGIIELGGKLGTIDNYFTRDGAGALALVLKDSLKVQGLSQKTAIGLGSISRVYEAKSDGSSVVTTGDTYLETVGNSAVYMLKSTETPLDIDGKTYTFDPTLPDSDTNVTSLKDWFRSDLFLNVLNGQGAITSAASKTLKNGYKFGLSHLYSIGANEVCPEGLTVFESKETVHFIVPKDGVSCENIIHQDIEVGAIVSHNDVIVGGDLQLEKGLYSKGTVDLETLTVSADLTAAGALVKGDATVGGSLSIGTAMTVTGPTVGDNATFKNLSVSGLRVLSSGVIVEGDSEFLNDLVVRGDLYLSGALSLQSFSTTAATIQDLRITNTLEVTGQVSLKNRLIVDNNVDVDGNITNIGDLKSTGSLTCGDIYSSGDVFVRDRLVVTGAVDLASEVMKLGTPRSTVELSGDIRFANGSSTFATDVTYYEPVVMFNALTVNGPLNNIGGIRTDGRIESGGDITAGAKLVAKSELEAQSAKISNYLEVNGSSRLGNLSALDSSFESINTNTLRVFGQLSLDQSTVLDAGGFRCNSFSQLSAAEVSYWAGDVVMGSTLDIGRELKVGAKITVADSLVISSIGISGPDMVFSADEVIANTVRGTQKIQPPSFFLTATDDASQELNGSIKERDFVTLGDLVCNDIAVFNGSVAVDKLFFNELHYSGSKNETGALDILVTRVLYG